MSAKTLMYWMVAALVIFLFWSVSSRIQRDERHISYSELLRYVDAGTIAEVTVSGNDAGTTVAGTFQNGQHFRTFAPPQAYGLVDRMLEMGVEVRARETETTSWSNQLISWFPIIIMAGFFILLFRGGIQNKAVDAYQWRLEAKARALERLSSSREDLSAEEILSCLLGDAKPKDRETEARKALYEMLAEKTAEVTEERKYRLKTSSRVEAELR
jgi:hypothetical protein